MEKSAQSRERDGPNENVARPKPKPLKEEHQKKKKLVFFELDNWNDDQCREFDVPSFKIEELYSAGSKECNGGRSGVADDGLSRESSDGRDSVTSPETCPLDKVPCGDAKRMIFDEFGIDLIELQNRILELEKQLKHDNLELPAILSDLKSQVENFRNKLETTEWRRKTELQKELFCQRFQYRRTSSERGRKIREKFLNICEKEINESTIAWLKQPSFDSGQYEDEEILLFIQHMFQELGFIEKFQIRLPVLRNFLYEVYKNYNEVPFHNFRHCFCVAQMMYVMIWSVDILTKMGDLDTLILLTACICHDLDHPGYNNIYQINARTDLALLYNDISPLENHHCSVAFRILENPDCNIFAAVDKETFREIREGIIRCILATDMARHNEILTQFKEIISDFDFTNKGHKNLLSMILIKVADISNEARPMNVAEPWLDRLLTEFFKQSDAEKEEGLPVTPFMDRDKITKPSSQCSFIGFVLLPLFEALGKLLPELHDLIITPAKEALEHYKRLNEAAKDERMRRKSIADASNAENGDEIDHGGMVKSGSGHSVRSRRSFCYSCPQVRQKSKSSDDLEPDSPPPRSPSAFSVVVDDFENLDERDEYDENDSDEEMDEETVTEVEVSEKTLKFKISTEGGMNLPSGRKSCPDTFSGSRKGSRERNQYLENDSEWSRMMRNRALKRSITSDTMSSGKGSSDDLENHKSGERNIRKKSESLEGRGDDLRWFPSSRYNDVSGRRKSLAVERPRTTRLECTVRRGSLASATKSSVASFAVATPTSKPKTIERDSVDSILEKFSDRSQELEEGRNSKEFETSCWGLQNLKIGAGPLTVIVPNVACDAIERKSIKSEKSKSEDNLSITTMASGKKKSESYVVLTNNANLAGKKEKGDEKGGQERKQNYTSILSRLKHLREKIAFGRETETTSEPATPETSGNSVASSAGLVKIKEKSSSKEKWNRRIETECYGEDFERSRTLPKTRKPSRTSGAKMRRGWRALIGKSEANSSSSSLDFPSPNSPSPLQRRKTSSEEGTTPTAATPPTTTQRTSTAVSLSDKKKSSTWLPSPKKSGFLGRIGGRCEFDVEGGRNNFLNSLTSSFRKKGTKNEDENGAGVSGSGENMATKKLN